MKPDDIELLSNTDIPEAVRAKIAEQILSSHDREAEREIEQRKLASEDRKFLWNTPVVAAVAGLITLSATFVLDRLTAKDDTSNTITLEQVRTELEQTEARLKQELELDTSENLAKLEAEAKEREFQYEIVRSELTNSGKSNADRAAVLLFLVRAGVLSTLNGDELRKMAEAQIENPESSIIPQLSSSGGIVGVDDSSPVVEFDESHPARKIARSVGILRGSSSFYNDSLCTTFLIDNNKIATAQKCIDGENYPKMQFELFAGGVAGLEVEVYEVSEKDPVVYSNIGESGYAVLELSSPVDGSIQPLKLDAGSGKLNARLGVIYIRAGNDMRAIWGASDCRAIAWHHDTILHLCDTGPGTTGSPIIELETQSVVVIHTGRSEFGGIAHRIVNQ